MNKDFMKMAINEAKKSLADIPVGCVIADKEGKIIAKTHNEKEKNQNPTHHAEILAINEACKKMGTWRLDGYTMYVTLEPCPMCAWAIINARIREVIFALYDTNYGGLGGKLDLRQIANSKLKVTGGIMEDDYDKILKEYFKKMRKNEGKA